MKRERQRKGRGEGNASINLLSSSPTGCVIELGAVQPASQSMPPDVRAFLINKLAEVLALDYQHNQSVLWPSVQLAGGPYHKPGVGNQGQRKRRRAS
jgi:hypothetical protein